MNECNVCNALAKIYKDTSHIQSDVRNRKTSHQDALDNLCDQIKYMTRLLKEVLSHDDHTTVCKNCEKQLSQKERKTGK